MWLTNLAIRRPIVIWAALAALAILGLIAYSRLPTELNPQVDLPTLTITTVYAGAGPREIETLVTRPIEDAVGTVTGVKDVFSSSQESVSIVSIDFAIGTDLDRAMTTLREKADAARSLLPQEARAPVVARLDINAQPVLFLALTSPGSARDLRGRVDNQLKPQIARVHGVAAVEVVGGEQREIQVRVDRLRLQQHGLTIEDVVDGIKSANRDIPAGSIAQGRRDIAVRTLGAFTSLEDIEQTPLTPQPPLQRTGEGEQSSFPSPVPGGGARGGGLSRAPLTVADVATVVDSSAPPSTLTRLNGRDSVGILVTRASNANTVAVVDGVRAMVDQYKPSLPPGAQIIYSRDDSVLVRDALEDVDTTLVLGAFLAMAVVFLFLHNLRGTLIISIALPACLVATFLVMYFAGFTLNQMTLLALSLSVGILIDDSIVVLESITRHIGRGEPPDEAAFNGRTEIGFADVTTTLVDVVVFLPIAFMGGIIGAFFRQFGLTIVVATLFSLVISFTVTPSLAARWYRQGEDPERGSGLFLRLETAYLSVEARYRRLLLWALGRRGWIVAACAVGLASALLFTMPSLAFELLPATDQGQVVVGVELTPDSSLAATDAVVRECEQRLAGTRDVASFVSTCGELLGGFGGFPQKGPQFAQVNLRLLEKEGLLDRLTALIRRPEKMRSRSDEEVAADVRARLKSVPGARITVSIVRTVVNTGPPVQIQLRGQNLDELASASAQLRDRLQQMPGVLDVDVSLRAGRPELRAKIDRQRAAALGVPPALAGAAVRDAIEGNTDASLRTGGTDVPIRVQLNGVDRNEPADVAEIAVAGGGHTVRLGQVATLGMDIGPTAIERVNGTRMVTVTANLARGYALGAAQIDIERRMADIPLSGIQVHWSGEAETVEENARYFAISVGLAVVLVYLVMASLFNNLLNPFIIMFTLPMALAGALGALVLSGESLSLVAMIGIIMLIGLMGRNAILLIDYTNTLRSRGTPRVDAIAEAGATRLRPILMTTSATLLGMLPVALRIGRAAELRAPMAIAVIGGLLLSSILTLVVIPVLYTLFDDLVTRRSREPADVAPR